MPALTVGTDCTIADTATLGVGDGGGETVLGDNAVIRSGTLIYRDVTIGDRFRTGHDTLIRENSSIGDDVLVGTRSVVDGDVQIGSAVSLQTGTYVPPETIIGDNVFFGPHAVVTNDPYPIRETSHITGAEIQDNVSIGANATILPGLAIGEGSFVAAGALVTEDVPPETLAIGTPATHRPLPEKLSGKNHIP